MAGLDEVKPHALEATRFRVWQAQSTCSLRAKPVTRSRRVAFAVQRQSTTSSRRRPHSMSSAPATEPSSFLLQTQRCTVSCRSVKLQIISSGMHTQQLELPRSPSLLCLLEVFRCACVARALWFATLQPLYACVIHVAKCATKCIRYRRLDKRLSTEDRRRSVACSTSVSLFSLMISCRLFLPSRRGLNSGIAFCQSTRHVKQ